MPRTKSLHNSVIKSPPQCPGLVSYMCKHVHPCMPIYTLMCTSPTLLVQLPEQKTCVLLALWRAEGTQPSPSCAKPGPGGSREKAIQSRAMSRRLILTESCRMTSAQKEKPPDGTLAPPEDIKMRLGNAPVLPFLPGDAVSPGQQSLFTSSVLGNLPSDPLGLAPITPVSFCCHKDLVAQGPSC